ncbi:protoporphyrinogen/coproporphyrinogen oxidase [Mycolicibacter senuensis]|uniref:protoporphyrinogen/coproporphyrinogen oxidase n=1 Tax=Mycolicibacter senuensis TaxID=386913 RepID=UPI000A16018F|nr:FAD-dependent oxidoreductase [Mycolicibacter senuensis]
MSGNVRRSAVVIGSGISGLTAGFRLHRRGYDVTVLEKGLAVGGKMSSIHRDGFTINRAANILPSSYSTIRSLIGELKLSGQISDIPGILAIPRGGQLHRIRSTGVSMLTDALHTNLFTRRSKLKARNLLIDGLRMKKYLSYENLGAAAKFDSQTAAQYCDRRLTSELEEFLVNPLLRALYCAESHDVSVVDFFFAAVNFVGSGFMSYPSGIGFLVEAIARQLNVVTNAQAANVTERGDDVVVTYAVDGAESTLTADACVIATPATEVPQLFPQLDAVQREILCHRIEYGTAYAAHFAVSRKPDEDAMVIPVPTPVDRGLCVVVLPHNFSRGAAPDGKGIVSTYWLGTWCDDHSDHADADLVAKMLPSIDKVLPGISRDVEFSHIERWRPAVVRSYPGMYSYVDDFVSRVDPRSRVQLAGDYMSASSTNGCATSAEVAAQRVIRVVG